MELTPYTINQLVINDSLVNDAGQRVELIDPGYPHEICYCVRLKQTVYFMSATTQDQDVESVIDFVSSFPWDDLGLPKPAARWRRERDGGADNGVWDNPLAQLCLPDSLLLTQPSPQTGRLKTQVRVLVRSVHTPLFLPDASIQAILCRAKRGDEVTTERQYVVGRCYAPVTKTSHSVLHGMVRIDKIERSRLCDMTPDDIAAEGYTSFEKFISAWRHDGPMFHLNTRVWVLTVAPVFIRSRQFTLADLLPAPRHAGKPIQLSFLGVG